MKKILISGLLLSLLAACAPNPPKPVPPVDTSAADAAAKKAAEEAAAAKKAADEAAAKKAADEAAARKAADEAAASNMLPNVATSVYYPFDVDAVQETDKPAIQAHAKYLADHAGRKMRVEGNADERGSNEYNLSLGQRRADGVKKMLELGGARADQVEAASLGEEKPKVTGHNEEAWSQNRRSDMGYK